MQEIKIEILYTSMCIPRLQYDATQDIFISRETRRKNDNWSLGTN